MPNTDNESEQRPGNKLLADEQQWEANYTHIVVSLHAHFHLQEQQVNTDTLKQLEEHRAWQHGSDHISMKEQQARIAKLEQDLQKLSRNVLLRLLQDRVQHITRQSQTQQLYTQAIAYHQQQQINAINILQSALSLEYRSINTPRTQQQTGREESQPSIAELFKAEDLQEVEAIYRQDLIQHEQFQK